MALGVHAQEATDREQQIWELQNRIADIQIDTACLSVEVRLPVRADARAVAMDSLKAVAMEWLRLQPAADAAAKQPDWSAESGLVRVLEYAEDDLFCCFAYLEKQRLCQPASTADVPADSTASATPAEPLPESPADPFLLLTERQKSLVRQIRKYTLANDLLVELERLQAAGEIREYGIDSGRSLRGKGFLVPYNRKDELVGFWKKQSDKLSFDPDDMKAVSPADHPLVEGTIWFSFE